MTTHNRTEFELEDIEEFEILTYGRNYWRQRYIVLYQHPTKEDLVISVGRTFDGQMVVIAEETKDQWGRELSLPKPFITQ